MMKIEFKTLVVPTDLSKNSLAVLPYAMELGTHYNATIHLLHVAESFVHDGLIPKGYVSFDPEKWMVRLREMREQELFRICNAIEVSWNVDLKPVLLTGDPHEQIVVYAHNINADCIVIASHGRSGFAHMIYGSVAEKLIRTATCPVFTVRPRVIIPDRSFGDFPQQALFFEHQLKLI